MKPPAHYSILHNFECSIWGMINQEYLGRDVMKVWLNKNTWEVILSWFMFLYIYIWWKLCQFSEKWNIRSLKTAMTISENFFSSSFFFFLQHLGHWGITLIVQCCTCSKYLSWLLTWESRCDLWFSRVVALTLDIIQGACGFQVGHKGHIC